MKRFALNTVNDDIFRYLQTIFNAISKMVKKIHATDIKAATL